MFQIRLKIAEQVGNSPFSIIADETTDISTSEQLCIVLRYFQNETKSEKFTIEERFLRFQKVAGVTGLLILFEFASPSQMMR